MQRMQRNLNIDFLRFIGLLLVILSHVQTPHWLHEVRCFDVPMMLFCSGLTCKGKSFGNYWPYIWRRTKRLIIPSYIFVVIFYSLFYTEAYITTHTFNFDRVDFINALLLRNDSMMGYLWVIKVFLLVMFITPLLVRLANRIKSFVTFIIILFVMLLVNQGLVMAIDFIPIRIIRIIYREYFLYLTGYSILFLLGVKIGNLASVSKKGIRLSVVFSVLVFVAFVSIYGLPFHLLSQQYKYPPQFWFILYGAALSVLLWFQIKKLQLKGRISNFCVWMGQNTIWLYLWHIIGLRVGWAVSNHWAGQYLAVLVFSVLVFAIQYTIVKKINKPFFNKYFIG